MGVNPAMSRDFALMKDNPHKIVQVSIARMARVC